MKSSIVLFGASGFIGTHLLHALSQTTDYNLLAVDHAPPKSLIEGVTYYEEDVRDLSSFTIKEKICLIINLAATHQTPRHKAYEYYETNILGANEVTSFARRHNVPTLLFTSSISVYGTSEETKTEQSPIAPTSAYGWSKAIAEKIYIKWQEEKPERRLIISRPAVVFGHKEGGNFCRLAKLLSKGFFVYPGRKDTIKSCFYIKDLIDSFLFAWKEPDPLIIFNACYPNRYTIEAIINAFQKTSFPKVKTFLIPRFVLVSLAAMLKPFSFFNLGIHPDRVMKLVHSTDITPGWLIAKGIQKEKRLEEALKDWSKESKGRFD